ncbi:MAG: hemolysin family protein [Smithellaceae bacterium]
MELIVIGLLILLNGFFSMYEIALVSARRSLLEEKAAAGRRGAADALALLKEPEKILSAIQVGITLIGILTGAYGGVMLAADVAPVFSGVPLLAPYAPTLAFVLVVGVMTYLAVVIGELVPKTIAIQKAEAIAMLFSPLMKIFSLAAYPLIWFLSASTRLILGLLRIKGKGETPISDDELRILLKKGSEHGVFEKGESDIINEVIRFGDKRAAALMTHRMDVQWIDTRQTPDQILNVALTTPHPRLLVCEDRIDQIKGAVNVRDILAYYLRHQTLRLDEIAFEPLYIPEQAPALHVLEMFRKSQNHFGVVVNEYGSIEGIITLHDLVENIMGDLPEHAGDGEPDVYHREDGSYLIDGAKRIEDVEDLLKIVSLFDAGENKSDINTIGGMAMFKLNRIPKTGDTFYAGGYLFEIVDMDGRRVDKLLVKAVP